MSGSATDWLAAREAVDARSRSSELAKVFATFVGPDDIVVDFGCGTGANIRYLAPFFATNQKWVGIDHDSEMLSQAADRLPSDRVTFEQINLATHILRVPTGNRVAVTASAFLDITSERWLIQFANHSHDTPLLVAMSVAGQPEWYPINELDEPIRSRIESHQRSDHGFGQSLGADAAQFLAEQLRRHECQVTTRQSDWTLGPNDSSLIEMLIGGVARRVGAMNNPIDVREWVSLRRNQLQLGVLRLVIQHVDLLSIPHRFGRASGEIAQG